MTEQRIRHHLADIAATTILILGAAGPVLAHGLTQPESRTAVSRRDDPAAQSKPGAVVACSASSADSDGSTANEKLYRGVIRRLWEKEAKAGMDGAVTIVFERLVVGAPRAWQATKTTAYSQADPSKPIYQVRATFSTCADFRTAISKRKMDRIYDCFVHRTGGWQCTQTGASGALALKDESEYIQKRQ